MARQRPRQRNKEASQNNEARQENKTRKKVLLLQKSAHSKSCGFHPKSRKAASLQTAGGFIFYVSTYAFYTSGQFDTCVKLKITRVEMTMHIKRTSGPNVGAYNRADFSTTLTYATFCIQR